ncbi:mucin-7-like, partial [Etheostoma cragini]|uniref:mucin-7-like n=1 Tax=Etheostoma cragini TaxID=417921 RepID=UPI00155F20FB
MVLQPVQTASGAQFYRKPDGKLVQLIPINQLRPVHAELTNHRVLPASIQTPSNQMAPNRVTVVTPVTPPSLSSCSLAPLAPPLPPTAGFLSPKGTCTFKILPSDSSREPITVTCPRVPPKTRAPLGPPTVIAAPPPPTPVIVAPAAGAPLNLISLKPSAGRGAELGVKAVAVAPPPSAEPAGAEPVGAEPAYNLVDLDIVCVDDEMELAAAETAGVELHGSSSETDNSSDFGDELDGDEDKETNVDNQGGQGGHFSLAPQTYKKDQHTDTMSNI